MITISGKSVFGGVSIGKILFYQRNDKVIKREHVDDVDAEWKRFQDAKDQAVEQLKGLYEKALEDVGEANAMIFEIHQMMLEDLDYLESIENIIRTQEVNAEYAVATTADNFAAMFSAMDDAYMQGRAADVKDVSERVLNILSGADTGLQEMNEPCIIAADDLAPSETVQLDKSKVLGFATMYGSSNSHTAILARTMNIPAVIGLGEDLKAEYNGKDAIIDGFTGTLYIEPDEETMKAMQEKRAKDLEQRALLEQLKGKENVTKSGQKINVYANIGNVSQRADRRSMSTPISAMCLILAPYLKTMPAASDSSGANSSILRIQISRRKSSSSPYIRKWRRAWPARRSSSVPSISERTSR